MYGIICAIFDLKAEQKQQTPNLIINLVINLKQAQ